MGDVANGDHVGSTDMNGGWGLDKASNVSFNQKGRGRGKRTRLSRKFMKNPRRVAVLNV